jgi:uncharacterized membrane protein YfhO
MAQISILMAQLKLELFVEVLVLLPEIIFGFPLIIVMVYALFNVAMAGELSLAHQPPQIVR